MELEDRLELLRPIDPSQGKSAENRPCDRLKLPVSTFASINSQSTFENIYGFVGELRTVKSEKCMLAILKWTLRKHMKRVWL